MNRSGKILLLLVAALMLWPSKLAYAGYTVHAKGDRNLPKIAITMDDCWKLDHVVTMLDLCSEYQFKMTFFPCGAAIREEDQGVWLRMVQDGHEIGNHTFNHRKLNTIKADRVRRELVRMEERLNEVLGFSYDIRMMRPPYGAYRGGEGMKTTKAIESSGYSRIVVWSISETDPDKMLNKVKNGDILLYHSNKKDVDGLNEAIPVLLERGFQLVTVSELLGLDAVETASLSISTKHLP